MLIRFLDAEYNADVNSKLLFKLKMLKKRNSSMKLSADITRRIVNKKLFEINYLSSSPPFAHFSPEVL